MLIAIFNMVGTLITDCDTATNNIWNSIQYIIKVFSQSELLENENIEKFIDYFNDRNACSQFKNDFFEIDDTQKNDTLYFDSSDNANNQYFVQLFIKQKSKDQKKAVLESVNNYKSTKAMRMVAHCTLLRLLSQKVKNYKLKKNTENTSIPANLSMNGFNWICLKSEENMNQVIKIASKDPKMLMYVDKIYEIQLQLMNIMNNHFSIRNSLDTHFVVARINETSEYLNYIRNYLSLSINEALYNKVINLIFSLSSANNSLNIESKWNWWVIQSFCRDWRRLWRKEACLSRQYRRKNSRNRWRCYHTTRDKIQPTSRMHRGLDWSHARARNPQYWS